MSMNLLCRSGVDGVLKTLSQSHISVISTDQSEDVQRPPLAKHVLHIGIDGLRPDCMVDATSGLPNIMGRLAYEGTYTLTQGRTVLWFV